MRKRKDSGSDVEFGGDPRRLTPIDVQQQQFRRSFRGYDEQEVDDFLDRVTEELSVLLEEKRTAQGPGGQVPTTPLAGVDQAGEAARAAEDIKRSARDQAESMVRDAQARAAAILRDAEARAGTAAGAGPEAAGTPAAGTAALSSFVSREREFLQRLAQLVQGHAEGVRDMVQAARRAPQAAASPVPPLSSQDEMPSAAPPEPEPPAEREVTPVPPADEALSASMPPETADERPADGGPVMESASVDPVAQRAAVVLLPEAGEPEEAPASPGAEPAPSLEAEAPAEAAFPPEAAPAEFAGPAPRAAAPEQAPTADAPPPPGEQPVPVPGRAPERAAQGDEDGDPKREADREASLRELFWG